MLSRDEERGVAIAEETEVVAESVIVDAMPVAVNEGADQQQQRGLGLVEIGNEHTHYLVIITGNNDNLGAAVKHVELAEIHPVE